MRHVLWIDEKILIKYKKQWIPVRHPLVLTGRFHEENTNKNSTDFSEIEEVGNGEKNKIKEEITSFIKKSGEKEIKNIDVISGNKRSLEELKNENNIENKNENKDDKISNAIVNDARQRFLARKKK